MPALAAVDLTQMLARRDARAAAQRRLLARHGRPLLQLTLVYPGPVKDTTAARALFEQAQAAIDSLLATRGLAVLAQERYCEPTGPEWLLSVDADATALKRLLVALEDSHPLGRLWDADVLGLDGLAVSRGQLGLPPRRCLLCDGPAHACARSAAHPLAELLRAIHLQLEAYAGAATA